jgi:hypothetical protein
MDWSRRIITRLPSDKLWNDAGPVESTRERVLSTADLRELLAVSPVRFVFLNISDKPNWVPLSHCFVFWKHEIQPHLAEPNARAFLADLPGGYCYFASEWSAVDDVPIVVLEKHH